MIVNKTVFQNVIKENVDVTLEMALGDTPEVAAHIIKVLTENYSYPIKSSIREAASNAYDSHIMADKPNEPFLVRLYKNELGSYNLDIQDFGLGMNEEDFDMYYMKIGNSTKRNVKGLLGYYGCGAKAPLSFLSSYEIITVKDGVEYKFLIFKGEKFPEKIKIYEEPTDAPNGVLIRMIIERKYYNETVTAIREQLVYFKTASIKIENDSFDYDNSIIYENDLFTKGDMYPNSELHINFGNVHYPIDWNILGIRPLYIPVGIKIDPDSGINPFFNRETLEYSDECKEIIREKIIEVADFFVTKYNESVKETDNVDEIIDYYANNKHVHIYNYIFSIEELSKLSNITLVKPTFKGVKLLDLYTVYSNRNRFLDNYSIVGYIRNNIYSKSKRHYKTVTGLVRDKRQTYLVDKPINKKIIDYLKSKNEKIFFVKKVNSFKLYRKGHSWYEPTCLEEMLMLKQKYHKSQWRQVITEYLSIVKKYEDKLIPINSIVIPDEWIQKRKVKAQYKATSKKVVGAIRFNFAKKTLVSTKTNCKFEHEDIDLQNIYKKKALIVYGNKDQESKLVQLFKNAFAERNFLVALVNESDFKILKKIKPKNTVDVETFMSTYSKQLANIITKHTVYEFVLDHRTIFNVRDEIRNHINKDYGDKMYMLEHYITKGYEEVNDYMTELIKIGEEKNYYNHSIKVILDEISKSIKHLHIIKHFKDGRSSYISTDSFPIIWELLKTRNFKIDYKHLKSLKNEQSKY